MRYLTSLFACMFFLSLAATAQAQRVDADVETVVRGNTEFGLALYQQLAKEKGNVFLSPYSISNALGMTYAGALGNTANEMAATLRFNLPQERLHPAFGKLIAEHDSKGKNRPFQLSIANKLFGQKDYGFLKPFLKITKDHYGAELEEINFLDDNEREAGRQKINTWVEKQTNNKIKDLLNKDVLDTQTRLVLVNAIYFKGKWAIQFDEKKTKPDDFFLLNGTKIEPPMMQVKGQINFGQHDDFSLVNLGYEGDDASMVVILPKKKDGLADVEKQLTPGNLQKWLQGMFLHTVDLKLPKFKFTSEFNLSKTLQKMGMKDAFDPMNANLRNMGVNTRLDQNLYISEVVHKAFVGVDEKSTEAAAATAVIVKGTKSLHREPPPAVFHADHPFIFMIRDQRTGSILFVGRVVNPQS